MTVHELKQKINDSLVEFNQTNECIVTQISITEQNIEEFMDDSNLLLNQRISIEIK